MYLWALLETSGSFWDHLGASGNLCVPLGASETLWETLEASRTTGSFWKPLGQKQELIAELKSIRASEVQVMYGFKCGRNYNMDKKIADNLVIHYGFLHKWLPKIL